MFDPELIFSQPAFVSRSAGSTLANSIHNPKHAAELYRPSTPFAGYCGPARPLF